MDIQITPEVAQFVHGIYAGGQYANESEVVTAAVRLLHQRQQIQRELAQGYEELAAGQRLDADRVFEELRTRAAELGGAS